MVDMLHGVSAKLGKLFIYIATKTVGHLKLILAKIKLTIIFMIDAKECSC